MKADRFFLALLFFLLLFLSLSEHHTDAVEEAGLQIYKGDLLIRAGAAVYVLNYAFITAERGLEPFTRCIVCLLVRAGHHFLMHSTVTTIACHSEITRKCHFKRWSLIYWTVNVRCRLMGVSIVTW